MQNKLMSEKESINPFAHLSKDYEEAFVPSGQQFVRGVSDFYNRNPNRTFGGTLWDIAAGGLGAFGAPVTAGTRSFASRPIEQATGIPKENTELALAVAGMLSPVGLGRLRKAFGHGPDADTMAAPFKYGTGISDKRALADRLAEFEKTGDYVNTGIISRKTGGLHEIIPTDTIGIRSSINPGNYRLKDLMDNPRLYERYPELGNMPVEVAKALPNANIGGYYMATGPKSRHIKLYDVARDRDNFLKNALLHETQHATDHAAKNLRTDGYDVFDENGKLSKDYFHNDSEFWARAAELMWRKPKKEYYRHEYDLQNNSFPYRVTESNTKVGTKGPRITETLGDMVFNPASSALQGIGVGALGANYYNFQKESNERMAEDRRRYLAQKNNSNKLLQANK